MAKVADTSGALNLHGAMPVTDHTVAQHTELFSADWAHSLII